ncbi:MAG: flavin reductase family protein, partial [Actinomycetes bacterium]
MTKRTPAPWDPAGDDAFVCVAVHDVSPCTKTFVLAPRRPAAVGFEAGQHATVEIDRAGVPMQRCYSLASPPTRPERVAITVKRVQGGAVTPWLHGGGLAPGVVVRMGEPRGRFTMADHPAPSYLLLTAGCGITPALSMLRSLYDLAADCDVVMVHSQRRLHEVPYLAELDLISRRLPRLRIRYLCSGGSGGGGGVRTDAIDGRLDRSTLVSLVPDMAGRQVLACGPPSYRAAARTAAYELGCPPERYYEESFSFEDTAASGRGEDRPLISATTAGAGGNFRIELRGCSRTIDCPAGTTVLSAAYAAGINLPSSCTKGLCGTCKMSLLAGEVEMAHQG